MNKYEFLGQLSRTLSGLPQDDLEERLTFYREMIEDRMEEGLSEEEAVAAVGSVEEIAAQAVTEVSVGRAAKEGVKPKRRLKAWEILLLALGSPLWFSLGIAAIAVVLALYASLWSVIVSLWAVFGSLSACAFGGVVAGTIFACGGHGLSGIAVIAVGTVCAGLSVFLFYGCKAATKGTLLLTKKLAVLTKGGLMRKGEAV